MNAIHALPADAPLPAPSGPPRRILMAEDDSSLRELNTIVLVRSGYAVDAVEDGAAAWEAINADSYDLLITDNNMPRWTGVDLLKKLRASRMEMPVVMATGAFPTEDFVRQPWLRPDAMLLKPYSTDQLVETVSKVLREAGKSADLPWPQPVSRQHRVLAVDADHDLRQLYADALSWSGCSVDVAEDGAAGWQALQAGAYDLLITEHDLPKLSGAELVAKARAARMALPVVMTADTLPSQALVRDPSLQLAATLMKPFGLDELLGTVKDLLRVSVDPRGQTWPPPGQQAQPPAVGWQL